MKKLRACAALLMLLTICAAGAAAQEAMQIWIGRDTMDAQTAQRLAAALDTALGDVRWTVVMEEDNSLRDMVLAGTAPDLAVCSPGEAKIWAQEGLLLPLQEEAGGLEDVQMQVLETCVLDETLFMAPLAARCRQLAVNRNLMEKMGLGYMLSQQNYPVWYPAQFNQILEEFLLAGEPAMDIWRPEPATSPAIEALLQAIYGGVLISGDGENCRVSGQSMIHAVNWLRDAVGDGVVGYCESRDAALERFLQGKTAIFLDWAEDALPAEAACGAEIDVMPYPSAVGLPVRSFEVTGVCAFADGNGDRDALRCRAAVLIAQEAQRLFGGQSGIRRDDAVWLWNLEADERGATLRSLFCEALCGVLEDGAAADAALRGVQTAMDTLR